MYYTVKQEGRDEFTVSRSRFICRSKPVTAEDEAFSYLEQIRKEHWDASHNVWAYVLGASSSERCSDDGEPQGTAGFPVLDVIRKERLLDVVVVVTRYFGGIKLGAGGLVRAYAQGAKVALDAGGIIQRRPYLSFKVTTDYTLAEKLKREFGNRGYIIKDIVYLDMVTLTVLIAPDEKESLYALTAEVTAGKADLIAGEEEYLDFDVPGSTQKTTATS